MDWFSLALVASAAWGLQYALWGHLVREVPASTSMFWYGLLSTPLFGAIALARGETPGQGFLAAAPNMLVIVAIGAVANLGILGSMSLKNATAATLVESSYPAFTALFAWLFFREHQMDVRTLAGFALVASGVAVVATR